MPALKYLAMFDNGFRSGFVRSPDTLQQGNSLIRGLMFDWDGPNEDLVLTYRVQFSNNNFPNGALNPNTLILNGNEDFITLVQVTVKKSGAFSWLMPAPRLAVSLTDAAGRLITGSNSDTLQSPSGFTSLSVQFLS